MSLPLETYGYLPQLETYQGAACIPTSFSNAISALARTDSSLFALATEGENITYDSGSLLRDKLATQYFFTSSQAKPSGSPVSIVIKGLLDYVADVNLASRVHVWVRGPQESTAAYQEIGGWGEDSPELEIVPPDRPSFQKRYTAPSSDDPQISNVYKSGFEAQDIKDALDSNSAVIIGLAYDPPYTGGHAVTATNISWQDTNANNKIDIGEQVTLSVIDPLDPSLYYNPEVGDYLADGIASTESDPLVQALGPAKQTQITLTQTDSGIHFDYEQPALTKKEGKLTLGTDPQHPQKTDDSRATGTVAFIGGLRASTDSLDTITGTPDADTLESDPGRQVITGGAGGDTFVVGDPEKWGKGTNDIITDFNQNQDDIIAFRGDELKLDKLKLANVNTKDERKEAARSNANLIYHAPSSSNGKGILFLNSNDDARGWGDDGGRLLKLNGVDSLNKSDLHLLS